MASTLLASPLPDGTVLIELRDDIEGQLGAGALYSHMAQGGAAYIIGQKTVNDRGSPVHEHAAHQDLKGRTDGTLRSGPSLSAFRHPINP
jgi:hypothetical protein